MFVKGNIIAGEFDSTINEFSLQKVKNFETESVLNEDQLNNIYHYLKNISMKRMDKLLLYTIKCLYA